MVSCHLKLFLSELFHLLASCNGVEAVVQCLLLSPAEQLPVALKLGLFAVATAHEKNGRDKTIVGVVNPEMASEAASSEAGSRAELQECYDTALKLAREAGQVS